MQHHYTTLLQPQEALAVLAVVEEYADVYRRVVGKYKGYMRDLVGRIKPNTDLKADSIELMIQRLRSTRTKPNTFNTGFLNALAKVAGYPSFSAMIDRPASDLVIVTDAFFMVINCTTSDRFARPKLPTSQATKLSWAYRAAPIDYASNITSHVTPKIEAASTTAPAPTPAPVVMPEKQVYSGVEPAEPAGVPEQGWAVETPIAPLWPAPLDTVSSMIDVSDSTSHYVKLNIEVIMTTKQVKAVIAAGHSCLDLRDLAL